MIVCLLLVTLVLGRSLRASVADHTVGWSQKHQWCRMNIVTTQNGQTSPNSEIVCVDQPYYQYFTAILQSPPSEFHLRIAEAVVSMYDDLEIRIAAHTYLFQNQSYIEANFPLLASRLHGDTNIGNENIWQLRIHPLSFSIPSELIDGQVPPKSKSFCQVVPGNYSTYFNSEEKYYKDLQRSLFAFTYKKSGWDCMRHYEILAKGCIPLFLDIAMLEYEKNRLTSIPTMLAMHPVKLYQLLIRYPNIKFEAIRTSVPSGFFVINSKVFDMHSDTFDRQLYTAVTMATMQYTQNVFSSHAMASYILQTVQNNCQEMGKTLGFHGKIRSVLYISHWCEDRTGDYIVDMTLHGLKKVLGENTRVVYSSPRRPAVFRNLMQFETKSFTNAKSQLYGAGVSFGLKLDTLSPDAEGWDIAESDVEHINNMIEDHEFDLIILGSLHRHKNYAPQEDPHFARMWLNVCQHYERYEVVLLEGDDAGVPAAIADLYAQCAAHIFSREGINL